MLSSLNALSYHRFSKGLRQTDDPLHDGQAAASSLNNQAEDLIRAVAVFKVPSGRNFLALAA